MTIAASVVECCWRVLDKLPRNRHHFAGIDAKDAKITKALDNGWEKSKHIYIIIKHQTPHLLDSFTKQFLDPMTDDMIELWNVSPEIFWNIRRSGKKLGSGRRVIKA